MENKVKTILLQKCFSSIIEDNCVRIKIVGVINTTAFQKARICVEKLSHHLPFKFSQPQITEMFQMDWYEYICKMKREVGGKIWSLTRTVAVFVNGEFLGSDVEFFHYISQNYIFTLPFGARYYEKLAMERSKQFMEKSKRKYVYFTLLIDDTTTGSFVFMLYSDLLPETCQHFLKLCTGCNEEKQCCTESYYRNTRVHRIVQNGWIQCGDTELSKIHDNTADNVPLIPDESYCIPHDRRGVLSMANNGKHSNRSQFFVCLKPNPWMNQFYVAFGQLVDGAKTLEILEKIPTYYEHPTKEIVISQCEEYLLGGEIRMETESKAFFKQQPPVSAEGEAVASFDATFDFYSITPWLDNVVDKIDVRDTASILMVERYLNGLYCLASDYEPAMDMRVYEKINLVSPEKYDTTTKLRDLLLNFRSDIMTDREKITFISEISKIILAYMFCNEFNEFCLRHISLDTFERINKILEIAHEISLKVVEKTQRLMSHECGTSKIAKIFEAKHVNKTLVSEGCMLLLEGILKKAILCLMKTIETEQ